MQETRLLQRFGIEDIRATLKLAMESEGFSLDGISFENKPYKLPYMKNCYAKGNECGMHLNPSKRFNVGSKLGFKRTTLFEVTYTVLSRMKQDDLNQYSGKIYIEEYWLVIEVEHRRWWKTKLYGMEFPNRSTTESIYKFKIK